jgi:hypothetical protein
MGFLFIVIVVLTASRSGRLGSGGELYENTILRYDCERCSFYSALPIAFVLELVGEEEHGKGLMSKQETLSAALAFS